MRVHSPSISNGRSGGHAKALRPLSQIQMWRLHSTALSSDSRSDVTPKSALCRFGPGRRQQHKSGSFDLAGRKDREPAHCFKVSCWEASSTTDGAMRIADR